MSLSTVLLAIMFVFVSDLAQAQAYRWVDKDGKTRYGDFPPPGVKAKSLRPPAEPASAPPVVKATAKDSKAGAAKPPVNPEQAFRERQLKAKEEAEKADKERADAERTKKNCDALQGNLRALEGGQRIATTNAQGERAILDDAGRQTQIAEIKAEIAKTCK